MSEPHTDAPTPAEEHDHAAATAGHVADGSPARAAADQRTVTPPGDSPAESATARRAQPATPAAAHRGVPTRPLLMGLLALIILAAAGLLIYQATRNSDLHVGDCVVITDKKDNARADYRKAACGDRDPVNYQAAIISAADQQCPNAETEVYEALVLHTGKGEQTVCLAPNLVKGACYTLNGTYATVDCSDPRSSVRVVDRLSVADATRCGADRALAYPALKLTYCLGDPKK